MEKYCIGDIQECWRVVSLSIEEISGTYERIRNTISKYDEDTVNQQDSIKRWPTSRKKE